MESGLPGPTQIGPAGDRTRLAFDTDGDRRPDYWQYREADGRTRWLAYAAAENPPAHPDGRQGDSDVHGRAPAAGTDVPGECIDLDSVDSSTCPHFLIALDGVPFELVEQMYAEGRFRLFYPPRRVISCFPSNTDLALSELFHAGRPIAGQALYFDPRANRMSSGNEVYLSARNSPWVAKITYRCSFWWDGLGYLNPQVVFDHEMHGMMTAFRGVGAGDASGYSVGTSGLGIRYGREAILKYLRTIDRLCEQIVHERRGRVKLTLTADHGLNLTESRRITFDDVLKAGGYRRTESIRGPRDVVVPSYGLVTCAEFFTKDPAGVARCLSAHEDVELAMYPEGDSIVVLDRNGRARVGRGGAGFRYDAEAGDPLKLAPILDRLRQAGKVSADGEIDAAVLFQATFDHVYPDPLARIWEAFHENVQIPPDVFVSLRDGACHGSLFFYVMIGKVSATHGSLNRINSTAFALTMLGELPPAMRSRDLLPELKKLRERP